MPTILIGGLTAFITTVMVEATYFVCHLWQYLFDGSALTFSWVEPLPAAGISACAVLLVGLVTAQLMSPASWDDRGSIDVGSSVDSANFRARPSLHPENYSTAAVFTRQRILARGYSVQFGKPVADRQAFLVACNHLRLRHSRSLEGSDAG